MAVHIFWKNLISLGAILTGVALLAFADSPFKIVGFIILAVGLTVLIFKRG